MTPRHNAFGQPIGEPVLGWTPRPHPSRAALVGAACRIEPLDPDRHGEALFAADQLARDGSGWTYLMAERPDSLRAYRDFLTAAAAPWSQPAGDPLFHAILLPDGRAAGLAAYLRIDRNNGVIEVGHINYSPLLQRQKAGTEAMYLMMRRAFDELGYRRYEWKCDSLNAPSRRAAERYGFRFEGIFHHAVVYKGRNRDTAWYAITEEAWPACRAAFEIWLAAENFTPQGTPRRSLAACRAG
jgi:RimJ/RimL family protein N-acetyltransferase